MRILVTGGAGYVGSVSVEALVEAGHEVVVLDDLSTGHRSAVPDRASLVVGSYGRTDDVAELLSNARIEAILHCGARSLVAESQAEPTRYYRDNVVGGVALLDAAIRVGVRRFVFSSTAAVYGIPASSPIREDAPLRPINTYGETKRAFEGALAAYGTGYGLRSVTLRYFNVAGATERNGEDHDPETHLIPRVLRAAEEGSPVPIFGDDYPTPDGTCVRDFIHVLDLAEAHLLALDATAPNDPRTDTPLVLNLGSGGGFSVREVVRAAETAVGHAIDREVAPRRAGDPPVLVASAERAGAVLGWRSSRSDLRWMIESALAWRQNHPGGYGG
jgi:UDP-glucose 4-epimerase